MSPRLARWQAMLLACGLELHHAEAQTRTKSQADANDADPALVVAGSVPETPPHSRLRHLALRLWLRLRLPAVTDTMA